jgi:Short C-terminal domain
VATVVGGVTVVVLTGVGPSHAAGGGLQRCIDKAADHNGEAPTCTKINGKWVASWPDDSFGGGGGVPAGFVAFFVLALVVGAAITLWKVSTARRLAEQSGMDPGVATQMALLTDDGLDATYLAASLRGERPAATAPPAPTEGPPATASARLEELKGLRERGLVTQDEYDQRRKAIIESV